MVRSIRRFEPRLGPNSAGLHHPAYDFNDEAIPIGASYWVKLVETALPG